jgi:dihydrofolate synthase/folylpolyglutamate synthase
LDYRDSIERLMSLVDHERTSDIGPRQKAIYNLSRIQALLELLGNPQTTAHSIHVAGTKGKGSTAALCDAALHAAGYRTGFYSSPHLHSFRERIRRDTNPISEAEFGDLVEKVWPHQQWVTNNAGLGPVSLFEFMTAMGFQSFSDAEADFQTIEVGLGGRLDATNVLNAKLCVITSISRDHIAILGDSLSEIATEKAGIIKSGSQVVIAPQPPEALEAVEWACQRLGVHPIQVGRDLTWERQAVGPDGQHFSVRGRLGQYQLTIPLLGSYQLENAATAVAALEVLREQGHTIPTDAIQLGFSGVSWPCRMEVLSRSPQVVTDGAHNLYSIEALLDSLPEYFNYHRLVLVLGFSSDKNVEDMVRRLALARPTVFATSSRHPRSLSPDAVAARFKDLGTAAVKTASTAEALEQALAVAGENDLVLATGSLFVAAEVREAMLGIEPEIYPDLLPFDRQAPQGL